MQRLKLSDAIKAAQDAIIVSKNRDNENRLVKDPDKNPYRVENLDLYDNAAFLFDVKRHLDDMCIYESFVNTTMYLTDVVDDNGYVSINLIDELVQSLADSANDQYREDSINPSIVKLYTANLIQSWKEIVKEKAIDDENIRKSELGTQTVKLAQQINHMDANQALLVQSFVDSLETK